MEVHQLRLLRELGERGSVAAVARALHVTPSAVSQHLAALQRSVPVPLTERRGRRLVLTAAGEALAAAAVEVSAALDRAERAVREALDAPAAPVRLAAFHSAGLAWFGPLLARLAAAGGPPLRCSDEDVPQEAFPGLVADHELVVAHRLDHSPPWPASRVAVVPLVEEPLDVALPADHPLAARAGLTAADVAGESWVAVHPGFPLTGTLDAVAALAPRPLTVTHRINEFFVAAKVVASGGAVALMPRYTVPAPPGVVLRPLTDLRPGRRIDVLARPEALARASVRTVLEALRGIAREGAEAGATAGAGVSRPP